MRRKNAPTVCRRRLGTSRIQQRLAADMLLLERTLTRCLAPVMTTGAALLLAACGGSGSAPVAPPPPAATASLSASPTTVNSGAAAMLTWSSTNASSCSASGGWSGALASSGSQSTGALTADTTYSLTCTGSGGTSAATGATVTVTPASPVPTATLTASPTPIASGGTSTLTWSSTNATSCTASGGWNGTMAASGTKTTSALTATTAYSLTCSGAGGTSAPAAATVTVTASPVPTATLTANPTTIASGSTSMLTWSSTNATSCTATGGTFAGTKATSGSQSTGTLTANTTYSLTCTGAGGTSTAASATVTIAPVPTATLTASPTSIASGGTSTLTWSSTNATSCTATGGTFAGAKATSGSLSTGTLTANTTYSLTCTGTGGASAAATATVTILGLPTASLTANPTAVVSGAASTLTWSSTNAASCTGMGGTFAGAKAASGSQTTGALTSSTSYSLTCSGTGGTSAPANASVTIATGSVTVSPKAASITTSQTQQFTATVPGGGTPTWSVDTIAGGNSTVGTIDSTGLFTPGSAAGTHTILATSGSDSGTATLGVTDLAGVYTFHNDLARDGANTKEYGLTTSNVNGSGFGKLTSCTVDGAIYGQPLWVANLTVGGSKHNVVFVATQHDSLYAFDADTSPCVQLWKAILVDTNHGGATGETSVPSNLVGQANGDISPEVGVTSTPVIDPAAGILYALAKSTNSTQTTFYQRLHAIDLATGNEKTGSPVTIAGTYPGVGDGGTTVSFNALLQGQRPGLALVNGVVYIAWASHGDNPPFYGWVMGYQYASNALTQKYIFNAAPNRPVPPYVGGAGIWMSGSAPAADSSNNIYVVTGNGPFDANSGSAPNNDYGDSLLQLSSNLTVSQYYTPYEQAGDNTSDFDLGAGGAAVLADLPNSYPYPHLLICGGKSGQLYVINRDVLGGYDGTYSKVLQRVYSGGSLFTSGAYWNNNFYIAGVGAPLSTYTLTTSSTAPFTTSGAPASALSYAQGGGTPSVSSAATANGIVWALDNVNYCTTGSPGCGPAVLHAYDATNLATELWNSGTSGTDNAGDAVKYTVPTIANGKVYLGTRGNNGTVPGELDIYALKP